MAPMEFNDIYPAVRRFLTESSLVKTLEKFNKATGLQEDGANSSELPELTVACHFWLKKKAKKAQVEEPAPLAASDVYPAVRRFLSDCGLLKTLRVFDKETGHEEDAVDAMELPELTVACQSWLKKKAKAAPVEEPAAEAKAEAEPKSKKRKAETAAQEMPAPAEAVPLKKKQRAEAPAQETDPAPTPKKKGAQEKEKEKKKNVPFRRVDDSWKDLIQDKRMLDNTHEAKAKFGNSAGDTWADAAAADLLVTKGKGFRKEMAKKKRASWRGGGAIDQGSNSLKFPDSDDE